MLKFKKIFSEVEAKSLFSTSDINEITLNQTENKID